MQYQIHGAELFQLINRPGVAGAVLQTPSLTNCKGQGLKILRQCSPTPVCHMPHVRCQVSGIKCNFFFCEKKKKKKILQSGRASRRRVYYQQGYPFQFLSMQVTNRGLLTIIVLCQSFTVAIVKRLLLVYCMLRKKACWSGCRR